MSQMMSDQREKYSASMTEIKERFLIAEMELSFFEVEGPSLSRLENAALQVRKIIELIAFASMSANLADYRKLKPAFRKEWRFNSILSKIQKLNKDFLPVGVHRRPVSDGEVKWHFDFTKDGQLSPKQLLRLHGEVSGLLHARNPFKPLVDLEVEKKKMDDLLKALRDPLWHHMYWIKKPEQGFVVELNDLGTSVTLITFGAEENTNVS